MDERVIAGVSLVPVALEAAVVGPALIDKFGRFAEMVAKFPPGAVSPELYITKLGEVLGRDAGAAALVMIGTFLVAELGVHVVERLLSRGGAESAPAPTSAPEPPKTTTVTVGGAPLKEPWDYQG